MTGNRIKVLCDSCIHEKVCRLPPLPTEWCSDYKPRKGLEHQGKINIKLATERGL